MKTKWSITFDARTVPGGAATILNAAGCGPDVALVLEVPDSDIFKDIYVNVKLDDGDERIAKLHELLNRYGVEVKEVDYVEYSNEDLQSAPLLWMSPDINEHVSAGNMDGTKYDMTDACANCATGARQTSALYIDGDDECLAKIRKHRAIGSYDGDIIVDGGMAKKLKDAGVTGISFGEVRARLPSKKWRMLAREQILIAHTMPPRRFEPTTNEDKYLCKVCRRGVGSTPLMSYRSEDLVGMQDFNLTWEWRGQFWPKPPKNKHAFAKWPRPSTLVTPKVMNIFRDAGVTTFEWAPMFLEE